MWEATPAFNSMEARLAHEMIRPNSKITTILSGGADSVTLLYYALSKTTPDKLNVISFDYGQKHKKELDKARELTQELGVQHRVIDISSMNGLLKSSLTSDEQEVPEGHYAENNMKATVVPNRNAIMLSMAYGSAISEGSDYLLYGAHSGDHFIYPDCRPDFVKALDKAFQKGNQGFGKTKLAAPFNYLNKSEIITLGLKLGVPYEKTWTCYKGQERPCLSCGTCVERTEAFMDNRTPDPLLTEDEWNEAQSIHKQATEQFNAQKKRRWFK